MNNLMGFLQFEEFARIKFENFVLDITALNLECYTSVADIWWLTNVSMSNLELKKIVCDYKLNYRISFIIRILFLNAKTDNFFSYY